MKQKLLLGTVFLTGAVVLILELSAIRLLSLRFGSSLAVISSVITVVLLSLSCGYYYGGKLADWKPKPALLYGLLALGGFLFLVLSCVGYLYLNYSASPGSLYLPLILSMWFFFLPAFLFGIDSPFVAKLLTTDTEPEQHGSIVGLVFFWSTLGSITGSLLTGFYLLPQIGLVNTLIGTSFGLFALCTCAALAFEFAENRKISFRSKVLVSIGLVFTVACTMGLRITLEETYEELRVLLQTDGFYSHIAVLEEDHASGRTARFLRRDANRSSAIFPGSTDIVFDYLRYVPAQMNQIDWTEERKVLFLGGGAYSAPKALLERLPEEASVQIDVVELEPKLLSIAHEYFELPKTEVLTNHLSDARVFLQNTDEQYDFIYIDVFNSGHFIPPHLATVEFFNLVANTLKPDGLLVMNVIGIPKEKSYQSVTGSLLKTVQVTFPSTAAYIVLPESSSDWQNIIVQARNESTLSAEILPPTTIPLVSGDISSSETYRSISTFISAYDEVFTDNQSNLEVLISTGAW